jgi:hypothetical protein
MKSLSAEDELIDRASEVARRKGTSLDVEFREWLKTYSARHDAAAKYRALMKSLSHIQAGRKFTRDEMNER